VRAWVRSLTTVGLDDRGDRPSGATRTGIGRKVRRYSIAAAGRRLVHRLARTLRDARCDVNEGSHPCHSEARRISQGTPRYLPHEPFAQRDPSCLRGDRGRSFRSRPLRQVESRRANALDRRRGVVDKIAILTPSTGKDQTREQTAVAPTGVAKRKTRANRSHKPPARPMSEDEPPDSCPEEDRRRRLYLGAPKAAL
jgi:hypothetical protein